MSLMSKTTNQVKQKPMGVMLHSKGGMGKTTFLADAVNSAGKAGLLFQCGEDGLSDLNLKDVNYYSDVLGAEGTPKGWSDFKDVLKSLMTEDHGLKLVAFDNIDNIINGSLDTFTVDKYYGGDQSKANAYGGAKIKEMYAEVAKIVQAFEYLQAKGVTVIVSSHSQPAKFKDPRSEDYKKWVFSVPSRDDYSIRDLLFNWSSMTMFGALDAVINADGKASGKTKVLFTQEDAAYDAKQRYAIPEKIAFKWSTFIELVKKAREA